MYDEFLNCNSYLYNMQDKQNSESISSDGEFNEFNQVDLIDCTDEKFILRKYHELLDAKYSNSPDLLDKYKKCHYIDEDLKALAESSAQDHKYLSKRLVTQNTGIIISRWASDIATLDMIQRQQKSTINPDAIFGRIDPRDTNMVVLKEMFETNVKGRLDKERGSSARQWNDNSEFATPNVAGAKYVIDQHNVNEISCFNPFQIEQKKGYNTKSKYGIQKVNEINGLFPLNS